MLIGALDPLFIFGDLAFSVFHVRNAVLGDAKFLRQLFLCHAQLAAIPAQKHGRIAFRENFLSAEHPFAFFIDPVLE